MASFKTSVYNKKHDGEESYILSLRQEDQDLFAALCWWAQRQWSCVGVLRGTIGPAEPTKHG